MPDNMINNLDKISTNLPILFDHNINELVTDLSLYDTSSEPPINLDFYDSSTLLNNGTDNFETSNSTNLTTYNFDNFENDWVDLSVVIIKGLIFSSIIVAAVLGNALVIISVQRNRKLR